MTREEDGEEAQRDHQEDQGRLRMKEDLGGVEAQIRNQGGVERDPRTGQEEAQSL